MLRLVEFIREHNDWEERLSAFPYFIKVSREQVLGRNLVLFRYDQLRSDFHNELVRECRGIILDEVSLDAVSVPFFKFGNYGESYVPSIDWDSAVVTEKLDGSIIKIVRLGNDLLISTNNGIDSSKIELRDLFGNLSINNYRDLVLSANPVCNYSYNEFVNLFDEGFTYIFELTSPYNRVIVPYRDTTLSLIGIRNNVTLEEELVYNHNLSSVFNTPRRYELHSLEETINSASQLPYSEEGYVVVDRFFNRVKVKSPEYLNYKYSGESLNFDKILEVVRNNEIEEFLTYFPEYSDDILELSRRYNALCDNLDMEYELIDNINYESRREFAIQAKDSRCSAYLFRRYDNHNLTARDYLGNLSPKDVQKILNDL